MYNAASVSPGLVQQIVHRLNQLSLLTAGQSLGTVMSLATGKVKLLYISCVWAPGDFPGGKAAGT